MSVLLAVMTCQKCSSTLLRNWPYFLRQGADWNYCITTTDTHCDTPVNVPTIAIGQDQYINGSHLPQRMINTIKRVLELPWNILILTEYDTLFVNRIQVENMAHSVAAHYAGGQTWGSKANGFYHNPWCFTREAAIKFITLGQIEIDNGICGEKSGVALAAPEGSPDVFFGFVTEKYHMSVQCNLWREYSRNSFDHPEHLQEARLAYRNGYDILHGLKTKLEFDYVTS